MLVSDKFMAYSDKEIIVYDSYVDIQSDSPMYKNHVKIKVVTSMDYLSTLILYCANQYNGERSTNAIKYMLQGKQSIQTIQDTVWYSLKTLFGTLPELTDYAFLASITTLEKLEYITFDNNSIFVTNIGKKQLNQALLKIPLPANLNGWNFYQLEKTFWQRITLLVQILSNWLHNERNFYPIEREYSIQKSIKLWLNEKRNSYEKKQLAQSFYKELYTVLQKCEDNDEQPNLLVWRLTGYKKPGYTSSQVAKKVSMDEVYYLLAFRSTLHFMIATIWNEKSYFPLLVSLIENELGKHELTNSGNLTYQLLRKGKTIEEIATLRRLKRNTIEDHIVEVALKFPSFSINQYVTPDRQKQIIMIANQLKTRKLQKIKEQLIDVDYFSIRLTLSKNY